MGVRLRQQFGREAPKIERAKCGSRLQEKDPKSSVIDIDHRTHDVAPAKTNEI